MSITSRRDALCYTVGESACSSPQLFQRQLRERAIDIYCTGVLFKQFTVDILFLVLQQPLIDAYFDKQFKVF